MTDLFPETSSQAPDITSATYLDAYSRINGVVIVGEGLANRHFQMLARRIPEDRDELQRLGRMEGDHASAFVGCGRNLGVTADLPLARRLFQPLHDLFRRHDREGDRASCLVIQGLIVECFAVAAYRHYLPVADDYARPVTAAVMTDEAEHLGYAETWLQDHFNQVKAEIQSVVGEALPITLSMLQALGDDMRNIGMDPIETLASFSELFREALEAIGFEAKEARRLLMQAAARMVPSTP